MRVSFCLLAFYSFYCYFPIIKYSNSIAELVTQPFGYGSYPVFPLLDRQATGPVNRVGLHEIAPYV